MRKVSCLVAAAFAVATGVTEQSASAQHSFSPTNCSACPTKTEVRFPFSTLNELPRDPNNSTKYINNLTNQRIVVANQHVTSFGFRLETFNIEYYYDKLYYGQNGGSLSQLTGNISTPADAGPWYDYAVSGSLQSTPGTFIFYTDYMVTAPGFEVLKARVCCSSTPSTTAVSIDDGVRYQGVLLATNDVVRFTFPADSTHHMTVAMWGDTPLCQYK